MKKRWGFTLIEVLVAMGIFFGVVMASVAFFSYGRRQGSESNREDYALQLAEDRIEILKTMGYDDISDQGEQTYSRFGTTFNQRYAASELYTYDEVYKVITISVTWTSDGEQKDVKLFSVISPKD